MIWSAKEFAKAAGGTYTGEDVSLNAVHTDSRDIRPGDCFVALKGAKDDGHRFLETVFEKGAALALVSTPSPHIPLSKQVVVMDTMEAFRKIASARREALSGSVIGLTGSAGKTTTKEMLRHVLSAYGNTYASEKSHNNHVGVPLSLSNCPAHVNYAIFEMGMNHLKEISSLTSLVRPNIAIITNVYPVHIGNLGSIENIAKAKAEIFEGLSPQGVALFNGDTGPIDIIIKEAAKKAGRLITFGEGPENDVILKSVESKGEGIEVKASLWKEDISYYIPIKGKHYGMNALIVFAVLKVLGLSFGKAIEAFQTFYPVSNRGAIKTFSLPRGAVKVIDESYNANPVAVKCALERLQEIGNGHRKIFIFGQMGELGAESRQYHLDLLPLIKAAGVSSLYVVGGEEAHSLYEACPPSLRGGYEESVEKLLPSLLGALQGDDVILVKGSLARNLGRVITFFETSSLSGGKTHAL